MSRSGSVRAKWTRIIREQQASGLSVAAFCAERGIAESSFYPWKRELGRGRRGSPPGPAFLEATVRDIPPPPGATGGVTIEVGGAGRGGRRVIVARGFDRLLLLEVLEALESSTGAAS